MNECATYAKECVENECIENAIECIDNASECIDNECDVINEKPVVACTQAITGQQSTTLSSDKFAHETGDMTKSAVKISVTTQTSKAAQLTNVMKTETKNNHKKGSHKTSHGNMKKGPLVTDGSADSAVHGASSTRPSKCNFRLCTAHHGHASCNMFYILTCDPDLNDENGTPPPVAMKLTKTGQQLARGGQHLAHRGQHLAHGGQILAQGRHDLAQGGQHLARGGQLLAQGEQHLAQGGQHLAQGGHNLAQGGHNLAQGEQHLARGGQLLAQGEQHLAQGGQHLAQGGHNLAQGGHNLAQGEQHLARGGQLLAQGEQHLAQGGHHLAQGGQNLAQGGQHLAQGLHNLAQGEQHLAQGEPTLTAETLDQEPLYINRLLARASSWKSDLKFKQKQAKLQTKSNLKAKLNNFTHESTQFSKVFTLSTRATVSGHVIGDSVESTAESCNETSGNSTAPRVLATDSRTFDNTLKIKIGNVLTTALVDTGATVSCISSDLLSKIHPKLLTYCDNDIPFIIGVGDKTHKILHKVQLQFTIDSQKVQQSFYALQSQTQLILGMDFITAHKAHLDFEDSSMTLLGQKHKLFAPPSRLSLVKTSQTDLIPPYSSKDVAVMLAKAPTSEAVIMEPIASLARKFPGVEIAESVASSQSTLCRLVNDTDAPVVIPRGTAVAVARNVSVNTVTEMDQLLEEIKESAEAAEEEHLDFTSPAKHLPSELAEHLREKLLHNQLRFTTKNLENLGDHSEHIHPLGTGVNNPNTQGYYRCAPKMQREIDNQIEKLLKHGIIEPSCSQWRSPVVLVKKKDGSYRFACDYRRLNSLTEKMTYPMPKLEDIWDLIGESKPEYFSVLDMASGFWQIRMDEETKHKASFVTRNGQYTWNRMPFGLRNAPITFQHTMNDVLRGYIAKFCIVYVDDIVVFSKDFDQHMQHLQLIFDRLEAANLTLKLSKCQFAVSRVKYLGHILSPQGVSPDPEKISIVQDWQPPKNPKQIRQFLGLTNYYRRFVPNYANIAKPLQNLTKKDQQWVWDDKCQQAFIKLRESLVSPPLLAYPDMDRPFILTTDASGVAISYILSQKDTEGVEHVISYAGRALRNAELNYGITDKEGLAVVEGFRHFHTYLCSDKTTTVITDHSALVYIKNNTKLTGRVARWAILLQNYVYDIVHRKGVITPMQTHCPESSLQAVTMTYRKQRRWS